MGNVLPSQNTAGTLLTRAQRLFLKYSHSHIIQVITQKEMLKIFEIKQVKSRRSYSYLTYINCGLSADNFV